MVCIYCSNETRVINSRPQKRLNRVWRRRTCTGCGTTFTSIESIDLGGSITVRDPSGLAPFVRDKLLLSIYESLKHRKAALADATGLTDTIISTLQPLMKEAVVFKSDIATASLKALHNFDKVAATHYKAFHSLP